MEFHFNLFVVVVAMICTVLVQPSHCVLVQSEEVALIDLCSRLVYINGTSFQANCASAANACENSWGWILCTSNYSNVHVIAPSYNILALVASLASERHDFL